MAHTLSAKKRIRQNAKARARNRWRRTAYRDAIKQYGETILHGSIEQAQTELSNLYKILDKTAAKGAIAKGTADRYKSRLTARFNHKKQAAS